VRYIQPYSTTLDDQDTRKQWPHGFIALYTVEVRRDALHLEFQVTPKDSDIEFTFAVHTYFAVPNIANTLVSGLCGVHYQDHLKNMQVDVDHRNRISFAEETDRTYMHVGRELSILLDDGTPIATLHTSPELTDAVVWS
jgi:glucose-6-phosphate 1-epimerase